MEYLLYDIYIQNWSLHNNLVGKFPIDMESVVIIIVIGSFHCINIDMDILYTKVQPFRVIKFLRGHFSHTPFIINTNQFINCMFPLILNFQVHCTFFSDRKNIKLFLVFYCTNILQHIKLLYKGRQLHQSAKCAVAHSFTQEWNSILAQILVDWL